MKSPHILSSVHDLASCARSAQTTQEKISSLHLRLSCHNTRPSFHSQDRPRCRPDDSCRSHILNSTSFAIRFHAESGSGQLEQIFHWTSPHSIIVGLLLPTAVIWNVIRKRSAWQHRQDHIDHSHTDPEPATRLAHVPHVPDKYTAICCCLCNRRETRCHHPWAPTHWWSKAC